MFRAGEVGAESRGVCLAALSGVSRPAQAVAGEVTHTRARTPDTPRECENAPLGWGIVRACGAPCAISSRENWRRQGPETAVKCPETTHEGGMAPWLSPRPARPRSSPIGKTQEPSGRRIGTASGVKGCGKSDDGGAVVTRIMDPYPGSPVHAPAFRRKIEAWRNRHNRRQTLQR